jgi:hypothetical protein
VTVLRAFEARKAELVPPVVVSGSDREEQQQQQQQQQAVDAATVTVAYARGVEVLSDDTSGIAAAATLAASSDLVVAVLGDSADSCDEVCGCVAQVRLHIVHFHTLVAHLRQ